MIKNLVRAREISVGARNEVGVLARMMSFLVDHGINVETIAGYSNRAGTEGMLVFITDDNQKSIEKLVDDGYEDIEEREVIVIELENRPGTLKNISELLAANGINIDYFYCTTCSSGCAAKMVFSTSDNDIAYRILNSA
ncbi:MAG: ACT domain-containing protein [Candidatus Omnitrophica bacterium]|nr:ACT domain-containing protein [Candidatus Omnitrophota bacterium]MBU1933586.1 ACT domain-containing protein [Candidatus Omnitrophota bacterium]